MAQNSEDIEESIQTTEAITMTGDRAQPSLYAYVEDRRIASFPVSQTHTRFAVFYIIGILPSSTDFIFRPLDGMLGGVPAARIESLPAQLTSKTGPDLLPIFTHRHMSV